MTALLAFLRLLQSIRVTLNGDDLRVMHQTVDQGDDAGSIGEHLAPFGEWSV
jgi:hypothetical protein